MMASAKLVAYLTCLLLGEMALMTNLNHSASAHQGSSLKIADVGESVTLPCLYESDAATYYWYKQKLGQKPRLMSITYRYNKNTTFQGEFRNNRRFTVDGEETNNLKISDLQLSDSATYYCARSYSFVFEFLSSFTVAVKASDVSGEALVRQSESENVHPGDSVTLNCTVHTGTCDGEHSVYWFKKSEDPQPGVIYTHGGTNDQCVRKNDTQTHTCVYNLPIQSLDRADAGTYYCAVASCGRVLFGNGTKLEFNDEVHTLVLVFFLSGALAITTTLVVSLAVSVYKLNKRNSCECTECQVRYSTPSATNREGYQDDLHYAALSVNSANASRRQRKNYEAECVYSGVRQSD
ncbi:immunoglobulin kappa light chain-like [Sphaeramia orbicularis]|uniref:immunoglobulin kappa light chain-like n=1 Tax=Sphaeramia orbicularis TaxID=375764 RepID=UPI00117E829E|nr:immunoglobulin kappa light chain-like [Sphaeramia orbicularis]